MGKVEGKVAVITAATSGMALATAKLFVEEGAYVFITGRRKDKLDEAPSDGGGRNVLRVYLRVDESGREVYRDMPVSIVEGLRNVGITSLIVWTIKGSI
jgi:NADP-dependent 3-hydroxy acid dehydrogenase YdfG